MPRVKLSEYRAKCIVYNALGVTYTGQEVSLQQKNWDKSLQLDAAYTYVAKVDQAVKKRNKLGLVTVNRTKQEIHKDLKTFLAKDYSYALVEPFCEHAKKDEHYIALRRTENGVALSYSEHGGIDIEEHAASLQHALLGGRSYEESQNTTKAPHALVKTLYGAFQDAHMTYLEINPCVIVADSFVPLDAAIEVDSAAEFFVQNLWSAADVRSAKSHVHAAERAVEVLAAKSPSSLSLKVLNENGSVFLLLSGGGASVVVADELSNVGAHESIANYGEYSGNPSEEETYLYAKQVLTLLVGSTSQKKVLLIAGGVANFTDVAKTFKGIMRAIAEVAETLVKQDVAVLVRRGGPNQAKGLADMQAFLQKHNIRRSVHGPEMSLATIVAEAVKEVKA